MQFENRFRNIFLGFTAIWFGHLILDFMLGIWPVYKTLAHLNLAKAGWIAGIGMFLGEGSQLLFGLLSDRGYQRKLVALGLGLVSCVALLAYTNSYVLLFGLMLCTYMGSGAFHPAAIGLVGNWSASRKGVYVALFSSGGMAGEAISQRLFSHSFEVFEGQTFIFLIPTITLMVWCYLQRFPLPASCSVSKLSFKEQLQLMTPNKKELGMLYSVQVLLRAIVLSFGFLLPDILCERCHVNWFCLGGGHGCYIMGSALMSVPAGYLSDRYGIKRVLSCAVACSFITFSLFIFSPLLSLTQTAILLFAFGACTGIVSPLIIAAGTRLVPPQACGLVSGLLMGVATCIASLSIIITGSLTIWLGNQVPSSALGPLGVLYFIVFFLLWRLADKKIITAQLPQTA